MESNRFTVKDSEKLKGIAIILMLMHHLFGNQSVCEAYGVIFRGVSAEGIRNISWYGKECVAIFAFISAYGITLSYLKNKGEKKWFIERVFRLYKGFWFVYILALIVAIITHNNPYQCGNPFSMIVYGIVDFFGLNNIFSTPSMNGAWWYMEIAVEIIILVPLAIALIDKLGAVATLMFALAVPKVLGVNYITLPGDGNNSFIAFFMIIMIGITCAKYNIIERIIEYVSSRNRIVKAILFIVNTLLVYCGYRLYISLSVNQFYDINYGLVPFVLIIWLRLYLINIPILGQVLSFLGKHSMNIFLVHIFIRSTYAQDFTFGFRYWELILLFLLVSSLVISFVIEGIKKVIKYDECMDELCKKYVLDKM